MLRLGELREVDSRLVRRIMLMPLGEDGAIRQDRKKDNFLRHADFNTSCNTLSCARMPLQVLDHGPFRITSSMVAIPSIGPEERLQYYELVEEGHTYREWCIPESFIKRYGTIVSVSENEVYQPKHAWEKALKARGIDPSTVS
jgi:hypothetical protein